MHPSEAVSTGCQLRLHGGVGLAVLMSKKKRNTEQMSQGGRPRPEITADVSQVHQGVPKRGGAGATLPAGGIKGGGSYSHLLSWGGYRSKWACAPLEGGRVVTKLWAAIHSCDRRVGMIERCVHDVNRRRM